MNLSSLVAVALTVCRVTATQCAERVHGAL